jgi:integrase
VLTDAKARSLRPQPARTVKAADGYGLTLCVTPSGTKSWYQRYRTPDGRQKDLFLGRYPEVGLAEARRRRDEVRGAVADGRDPSVERKASRAFARSSFEDVAKEWMSKHPEWSDGHAESVRNRLNRWAFPMLGREPVSTLTAPFVLEQCLRPIERHGAHETAQRVRGYIGQVMRYAIATGRAERDVTADLRGALTQPKKQHYAAVTEPEELGRVLRCIDAYQGTITVRIALQLTPMLLLRPGELRQLRWGDISDARIEIPADRMKTREPHIVPLARQACTLLDELRLFTGRREYVFPSGRGRGRPMSENAVNAALKSMGLDLTPHGFRATARTMLDEVLKCRPEYIEHQLAHAVRDPLGRAYNRTKHLPERTEMMQAWADYLESIRKH